MTRGGDELKVTVKVEISERDMKELLILARAARPTPKKPEDLIRRAVSQYLARRRRDGDVRNARRRIARAEKAAAKALSRRPKYPPPDWGNRNPL